MRKFRVAVLKEVSDLVRYDVDVEAESAEAAVEKVKAMDKDEWEFRWWQCVDSGGELEYDPRELGPDDVFYPTEEEVKT